MNRQRSAIVELFVNGNTPSEIMKTLGIHKERRMFVYRTIQRYKDTGDTSDRSRSGRPISVTTQRMKNIVRFAFGGTLGDPSERCPLS